MQLLEQRLQFFELELCVHIYVFNLVSVIFLQLQALSLHFLLLLSNNLIIFPLKCCKIEPMSLNIRILLSNHLLRKLLLNLNPLQYQCDTVTLPGHVAH